MGPLFELACGRQTDFFKECCCKYGRRLDTRFLSMSIRQTYFLSNMSPNSKALAPVRLHGTKISQFFNARRWHIPHGSLGTSCSLLWWNSRLWILLLNGQCIWHTRFMGQGHKAEYCYCVSYLLSAKKVGWILKIEFHNEGIFLLSSAEQIWQGLRYFKL